MKIRLALTLLLLASLCANAQSDRFRQQYEEFKRQSLENYSDFRSRCNKSYADFLEKAWASYGSVKEEKPKDEPLPPVHFDNLPIKDNRVVIKDTVRIVPTPVRPQPVEPIVTVPDPAEKLFAFKFFGDSLKVRADRQKIIHLSSTSEKAVSDAWKKLSRAGYEGALEDFLRLREQKNYCDWAYLLLIHTFSDAFAADANDATVLSAWLLCQSGYKVRIGRAEEKLCFLFASDYTIYGANCFKVDGENFYCMNCTASNIKIADKCRFPKEQKLSFGMENKPVFGEEYSAGRELKSESNGNLRVRSSVNTNLIKFLSTYPDTQYGNNFMTRWANYAQTPVDAHCMEEIYPVLKSSIAGKSGIESANILLEFVQTAFKYEYDDKVWGHDRVFFVEETLYYDYCDCEDRAILYSRLVRDLLGLDVALIYYPGHLATAVKFGGEVPGDYFELGGERFTVCDPTYIGAPVGATMEGMEGKGATLILLKQ